MLNREALPPHWEGLAEFARGAEVPPLDVLRSMLTACATPRISPRLANALVEAIIEAHATGPLAAEPVLHTKRLRRLQFNSRRAVGMLVRRLSRDASFWPAVIWACANDLQGVPKH
eukprot:4086758-Prymnesium_polylepis.1